jgi:hypothetical protein
VSKIEFDASEVRSLALDLSKAPGRIQRSAPKVLEVGAFKTKRNLQRMASGHRFLGGLDSAVAYDALTPLHYEIGFDKGGVGSLANVAVYGTSNNAPVMGTPMDALRLELPSIMRHLSDEGEDAVLGGAS